MTLDQPKPNKILRGPLFAEPVEVIVTVPSLNILRDPSTLDWQAVTKVEHYRLRQDSIKHPVELKEDPVPYRTGENL